MFKSLKWAAMAVVLACPAMAASVDAAYTSFFVLGDSLSDQGNIPQAQWQAATGGAPFYDVPDNPLTPFEEGGTFSNGDTWVKEISDAFSDAGKFTANLAVGGATAGTRPGSVPGFDLPDQSITLQNLLLGGFGGSDPLVAIWFGANDIFGEFNDQLGAAIPDFTQLIDAGIAAAQSIVTEIDTLIGAGVADFLVMGLPDLGLTPLFGTFADTLIAPGLSAFATAATDAFNATLASELAARDTADLTFTFVDTSALLTDAATDPAAYGYATTALPCVYPDATTAGLFGEAERCAAGVDVTRLFVDSVHPEAGAHQVISQAAASALPAVPLPAGAWLMLGAFGALALRRRAA